MMSTIDNPFTRLYNSYPDNNDIKEVSFYIDTKGVGRSRHCYIGWSNGVSRQGKQIHQQIHLLGCPGRYMFYPRMAGELSIASVTYKRKYVIDMFTRETRDRIIDMAITIKYDPRSRTMNCQDWICSLLVNLLQTGIIRESTYTDVSSEFQVRYINRVTSMESIVD